MKKLSQFPRKISAKFCFQVDKIEGNYEDERKEIITNPQNTEKIDYREIAQKTAKIINLNEQYSKNNETDELFTKVEEWGKGKDKIKVKVNPDDPALVNNKEASNDLAADVPSKRGIFAKIGNLFSNKSGKELNEAMDNVVSVTAEVTPFANYLGGYSQFEDEQGEKAA